MSEPYIKRRAIITRDVWAKLLRDRDVQVSAYAPDSDTPFVILRVGAEEVYLEDCAAKVLIKHLEKALQILPSSK